MYATTQHDASKVMIANPAAVGLDSGEGASKSKLMSNNEGTSQKSSGAQPEKITSRFGVVTVDKAKSVLFPMGILGMPDMHHFALTDFPNPKLGQFKLLQSLDDHELSFICLPIDLANNIVEQADIENACRDMEIAMEDVAVALIVSVHRGMTNVQLSVNARAPIFIDTRRQAAAQYVFTSSKYKVQHFITGDSQKDAAE
jgi:flagellar assembly factor FliW